MRLSRKPKVLVIMLVMAVFLLTQAGLAAAAPWQIVWDSLSSKTAITGTVTTDAYASVYASIDGGAYTNITGTVYMSGPVSQSLSGLPTGSHDVSLKVYEADTIGGLATAPFQIADYVYNKITVANATVANAAYEQLTFTRLSSGGGGGSSGGSGGTTTPTTATLHVIKHVINDDGGKAVAANFNLHVKTSGSDVTKSPAPGVESPGTTYTLAAGTYVVSEDAFAGYTVSYSGDSDISGKITLASGVNKTVTITNNDIPLVVTPPVVVTPPIVVTPTVPVGKVVTRTVTGGQLPKTSTPLYELLLIGVALTLVGVVGWRSRKRYE